MSLVTKIDLDAADQAALRKLNDSQQGMQNFIQAMMRAAEARAAALQAEGRELFAGLGKKHGLDLTHNSYVPSQDGTKLLLQNIRVDTGE